MKNYLTKKYCHIIKIIINYGKIIYSKLTIIIIGFYQIIIRTSKRDKDPK